MFNDVVVPKGADAYLLSRVIHDWDDERALVILRNCRRAAETRASLLLIERMLPEQIERSAVAQAVAVSDLNMLVMTGGRERTAAQYCDLLAAAAWQVQQVIATNTALSVIHAVAC
jgi:O-methyltransferase domain